MLSTMTTARQELEQILNLPHEFCLIRDCTETKCHHWNLLMTNLLSWHSRHQPSVSRERRE